MAQAHIRLLFVLTLIEIRNILPQIYLYNCKFAPTCSIYVATAIRQHGVRCGLWQGIHRLCRCVPWAAGGYDPIDKISQHNG